MRLGTLVADRFEVLHLAGTGGMGDVYRAVDRQSREPVALKVMQDVSGSNAERFQREGRVLAELSHPAVVRYVAHGALADGRLFLAMEWLQGEDVALRLGSGGLSVAGSVALVKRAAQGLGAAHARGVVHRDIKPSNLFLVDGDPERVKVIDFGVARRDLKSATVTRAGMILGTVGYMAPEQARGASQVDARADVFSLGCVLYECLTGVPAFSGDHAVAVLAKLLREEAPRLRELRRDVPEALDELCARMLSKDPAERPASAAAVALALDGITGLSGGVPGPSLAERHVLTDRERRFASVLLIEFPGRGATRDATLSIEPGGDAPGLTELLEQHAAQLSPLAGGALLVTLAGTGSATDQAACAARLALRVSELLPHATVALATGLANTRGGWPVGPAIDRAAALLRGEPLAPRPEGVLVDEVTVGLLDARFEVRGEAPDLTLVSDRGDREAVRRLLGRPTPCVGRARDLAMLEATLAESTDEGVARAVLVTAAPGTGKSRLRQEFVGRATSSSELRVLFARADAVGAGSPLALARALLRRALGLREADAGAERDAVAERTALRRYAQRFADADRDRIADFLGEIIGAQPSETPSAQLVAARNDGNIMREWIRRSFAEWLASECDRGPLLLVLEDVHWGDHSSMSLLGEGLKQQGERPLMILALARPEVHQTFPGLWSGTNLQELRLAGLGRKAATELVHAALGDAATADTVARIVTRADGNAFFLEELIRRVASGAGDALPDTVLAMVQSRLDELDPDGRRVLRAASVFGELFRKGALAALLGGSRDIDDWLRVLVDSELLERGTGDDRYAFRHALLREAAYASLTDSDRQIAHRLAAEWLEETGDADPLTLAEHLERAGELARASPFFARAAQLACDAGSSRAAIALSARGLACEPPSEVRCSLLISHLLSAAALDDWPPAVDCSREVMTLSQPGSALWMLAASSLAFAGIMLGDPLASMQAVPAVLGLSDVGPATAPYGRAFDAVITTLVLAGQGALATSLYDRCAPDSGTDGSRDLSYDGWMLQARAQISAYYRWDLCAALRELRAGIELHRSVGLVFGESVGLQNVPLLLTELGRYEEAEALASELIEFARKHELRFGEHYARFVLGRILIETGRPDQAEVVCRALVDLPYSFTPKLARAVLAHIHLEKQPELALREALASRSETPIPSVDSSPLAVLAEACLALGRLAECIQWADQGISLCESRGTVPSVVLRMHLARARALRLAGDVDRAHATLTTAKGLVDSVAALLDAPERASFLTRAPAVREALAAFEDSRA